MGQALPDGSSVPLALGIPVGAVSGLLLLFFIIFLPGSIMLVTQGPSALHGVITVEQGLGQQNNVRA